VRPSACTDIRALFEASRRHCTEEREKQKAGRYPQRPFSARVRPSAYLLVTGKIPMAPGPVIFSNTLVQTIADSWPPVAVSKFYPLGDISANVPTQPWKTYQSLTSPQIHSKQRTAATQNPRLDVVADLGSLGDTARKKPFELHLMRTVTSETHK
jgi:hypothetical protein